jgi:hypothetical protein
VIFHSYVSLPEGIEGKCGKLSGDQWKEEMFEENEMNRCRKSTC